MQSPEWACVVRTSLATKGNVCEEKLPVYLEQKLILQMSKKLRNV